MLANSLVAAYLLTIDSLGLYRVRDIVNKVRRWHVSFVLLHIDDCLAHVGKCDDKVCVLLRAYVVVLNNGSVDTTDI